MFQNVKTHEAEICPDSSFWNFARQIQKLNANFLIEVYEKITHWKTDRFFPHIM